MLEISLCQSPALRRRRSARALIAAWPASCLPASGLTPSRSVMKRGSGSGEPPCGHRSSAALSSARQDEYIPFAPHGPQEARIGRILFNLLAQAHDPDVDGARRFGILGKADGLRQGSAG